jgi:mannose-6-phosphate isomerase
MSGLPGTHAQPPLVLPANQPADRFYVGGARIAAFRGTTPAGARSPEDWVASTTTVAGEASLGLTVLPDGRTLRDAVRADPVSWLGPDHVDRYGSDPALLVKLLDAGERLPVHVHPDDEFARRHLSCRNGKTESWIILEAEPGARVHVGFSADVPPERLAEWVQSQDREAMLGALHAIDVGPGDSVYVPAGLPHAIGEGILLLELQQAADASLLLEYAGYAIDGAREGHLGIGFDTALGCVRHSAVPAAELEELRGTWADPHIFPAAADSFFRADRIAGSSAADLDPGFSVVVVTDGAGRLSSATGDLAVRAGTTVVVPWGAGPVRLTGDLEALRCRPPA